jgi:hypothetical protein
MNYITFKGNKLPLKFNYRVIRTIKAKHGVDLTTNSDWMSEPENREALFFEMFKEGHRMEAQAFELVPDDIIDLLSENHVYADILYAYQADTIAFITPSAAAQQQPEDKKKAVKK